MAIGFLSLGKVQNFLKQVFALFGSILKSSKRMLYCNISKYIYYILVYILVYIGMKEGEYD